MKRLVIIVLLLGTFAVSVPQAEAVYIVDTGTPIGTSTWSFFYSSDENHQWLAGQFTTTQDYIVSSLEGYIREGVATSTVDAVLYLDNAGTVDPVGEIFRQSFNVPGSVAFQHAWRGLFGLNENLTAGTYWLAFESTDSNHFSGMLHGAPNPMAEYAGHYNTNNGWEDLSGADVGMRINARPTGNAVPEPMSMMLFGTGLAGAVIRKRFLV